MKTRSDIRRYGMDTITLNGSFAAKLAAMRAIKSALDPQGIMNPAKLFT